MIQNYNQQIATHFEDFELYLAIVEWVEEAVGDINSVTSVAVFGDKCVTGNLKF